MNGIEELLEEIRKEKTKLENERKEKAEKSLQKWRQRLKEKEMKEQEKKEKLEKEKALSKHWEMMKWVTKFIDENKEKWEEEQIEKEMVAMQEIYEWDKYRLEKIEKIKNRGKKKLHQKESKGEIIPDCENWRENRDKENESGAQGRPKESQAKVGRLNVSELAPLPENDEESFHKDCLRREESFGKKKMQKSGQSWNT